jgi:hypothetical protein
MDNEFRLLSRSDLLFGPGLAGDRKEAADQDGEPCKTKPTPEHHQ